jgi:hypothetical protein
MYFNEISAEKRRQLINTQQVYDDAWRPAHQAAHDRYAGMMRWHNDLLTRKIGNSEKSLGPRNPETEAIYKAFVEGQARNQDHLQGQTARLDELAPVNVAMGLGRLPLIASRILRAFDDSKLLGEHLIVVGTNALFAYEAKAGVHIKSDVIATDDFDLLFDARRHMSFIFTQNIIQANGFIGILRSVDKSFESVRPRGFRAKNRDGYLVDLIRPQAKDLFKRDRFPAALTDLNEDLEAAAIFGLEWLINSQKLEATVIDEKGYPVRMVVIDPRSFALHKAWLSNKDDRAPLKRGRDLEHAKVAATIATRYLRLSFEDRQMLSALPKTLVDLAPKLLNGLN